MTGDSQSSGRLHPLVQLVRARILEFIRQPEAVFWVYVFPLLMMVALGIAFRTQPVDRFDVEVIEGPHATSIRSALENDERFDVGVHDEATARGRLRSGDVDVVVGSNENGPSTQPTYDYYFDPTRPGSVLARNSADDVLQEAGGRADVAEGRDHPMTEPGGRYIDFLVPGLIGMGLLGGGLWGVGFAVVDLRIRKLLKRYVATPMKRSHFLGSMMVSRLIFTITETALLLLFARLVFGVENYGSYAAVSFLILLGAFEFAGIGLLVACRAETLETVSGLMNLVMLPMWIASGIFYSVERFPDAVQPLLRHLPLTLLIDALRAVMQEGAALASQWYEVGWCMAWGAITFFLALRWFRWN
jgi:ABC-type multidrug transport system permease subunit